MDARGRRYHVHRGDSDAGEGADHPDRAVGGRDERVRPGGVEPVAGTRRAARDSAGRVHADRRAPAPAGRGGAEGRSVGRDRDRDRAGVAVVPPSVAPRCGDDGRAHAARAHPPDRGAEGETDGGGARGRQDGGYHERGYLFVLAALEYAQGKLPARRHLSGGELAWACRDFAREQFGLLAPTVLGHWGIASTEDLGRIVFMLIDVGLLASQPTDKLKDFERG